MVQDKDVAMERYLRLYMLVQDVHKTHPFPWSWDPDKAMIFDNNGNSVLEVHVTSLEQQDKLVALIMHWANGRLRLA